ncbi:MAG: efflux RND transporter periplasmic adaptor subunit [Planctomycetota bacterium]
MRSDWIPRLFLLFVSTLLIGCGNNAPSLKRGAVAKVRVNTVAATAVENASTTTTQPATVHPFFETEIRGRVAGYVKSISADIGDPVQAGQVLANVDVPEMEKQRLVLESRVHLMDAKETGAAAGVELAEAGLESSRAKLRQAEAEIAQADAMLAAAEAKFARTRLLVERRSIEARVLDEVREERDAAAAKRDAAGSAVGAASAEVRVATAEVQSAQAMLQTAQAETAIATNELAELDVMMAYATIVAPFSGVITERAVQLGDLIGEHSETLFVLSQIDTVRIQVPVPEIEAPFIRRGDALSLRFPSFSDEPPITATITRRSGRLSPSTRMMTVEAEMKNPDGKLLPGMFGEATITADNKVARTVLPSRAVRFDETGNAFVYRMEDDNRVRVTPVTTGADTGTEIEILSGLDVGQVVIDAHLKRFSEGEEVLPL